VVGERLALARVRYRRGEEGLEVVGLGEVLSTELGLVANREVLEPAGLTSLRAAMRRYEYDWGGGPVEVHLTPEPEDQIDDDSQIDEFSLILEGDRLLARVYLPLQDDEPDEEVMRAMASPVLGRKRMSIVGVHTTQEKWGWGVWLTMEIPIARRSVGEACRATDLIAGAIAGAYPEEFDVDSAASVIRARQPELLVGMFESGWFDAKSAPYRLSVRADRYELGKDIAAFANAGGGLILVGAKTKSRPTGDEVSAINGCVLADVAAGNLRAAVRKQIYPLVKGIRIERIPIRSKDQGVVLIEVPAQPESQKPFLVVGTSSGGRVSELGFTLSVREGDGVEAPRIEVIHQLIRAGRAVISGGAGSTHLDQLKAEVEELQTDKLESWVSDIVLCAVRSGFDVEAEADRLIFKKSGNGSIAVQATAPGPPADLLMRQQLVEDLADLGLPVRKNAKGFLEPVMDQTG
jgi:Putative DNA-binding domain